VDCVPDVTNTEIQGSLWYQIDVSAIFLSLLSLSFVSWAILWDKRIRGHPNNIIALICLCDAYTYCQYFQRYVVCGYGWNFFFTKLFSWTAVIPFWTISLKWLNIEHCNICDEPIDWKYLEDFAAANGYWYGSVGMRLQGWYFCSIAVTYCSLFFSLATVVDLYLLLRNPFSSSESRINKFIFIAVVASFVLASLGLSLTKRRMEKLS